MPALIHFSDPAPAPVTDRPAAERAIGTPPLRTTWERYVSDIRDINDIASPAVSGSSTAGLSVGEWACEPGAWKIAFHAGRHEFFHVLAGRLRIHDEAGHVREFRPGDACVIPAGFCGVFEVIEPVRKRYVMISA